MLINHKYVSVSLMFVGLVCAVSNANAANVIVSKQGGKCLNAEGGARDGARIIAYNCSGAPNEDFRLEQGRLMLGGMCAQADTRKEGSEVRLRRCDLSGNGNALQNFAPRSGNTIGHNTGHCLDLKGGIVGAVFAKIPWVNQPAVLWGCHGQDNQAWFKGNFRSGANIAVGTKFWVPGVVGAFEMRSGNVVASGGGNVVASGDGNVVASGGGNIVSAGAGN